ncbi:proline iminopeptidase [Bacillus cytotoxicus NVH 391-98]|uniref:Proline iminopeptidase n=2 Tax=Bacillus cytotoxicus TaxID=580165 RepID=A0AAX2CG57_9BACI|nr:proline iminopeptidase [Bacillus cytotoxicus NVH 391-98]SCL91176.1 Proline iminopeptidase [Bacillus cytotoxicus]
MLSKLKTVKNPMLLMVGKYDVVTCEKQVQAFHQNV